MIHHFKKLIGPDKKKYKRFSIEFLGEDYGDLEGQLMIYDVFGNLKDRLKDKNPNLEDIKIKSLEESSHSYFVDNTIQNLFAGDEIILEPRIFHLYLLTFDIPDSFLRPVYAITDKEFGDFRDYISDIQHSDRLRVEDIFKHNEGRLMIFQNSKLQKIIINKEWPPDDRNGFDKFKYDQLIEKNLPELK